MWHWGHDILRPMGCRPNLYIKENLNKCVHTRKEERLKVLWFRHLTAVKKMNKKHYRKTLIDNGPSILFSSRNSQLISTTCWVESSKTWWKITFKSSDVLCGLCSHAFFITKKQLENVTLYHHPSWAQVLNKKF